jgi:hypothetical protein
MSAAVDRGKWMYGVCCAGNVCPSQIDGVPSVCKASRCVRVERQSKLKCDTQENSPIVKTPISKPKDIVVPDTVDLYKLLSCTTEFQPSENDVLFASGR